MRLQLALAGVYMTLVVVAILATWGQETYNGIHLWMTALGAVLVCWLWSRDNRGDPQH